MRRRGYLLTVVLIGLFAMVQAQPREGGRPERRQGPSRGMRFGGGMGPDADWTLLCFELKVSMETLGELRPAFQRAHDDRRELIQAVRQGERQRDELMEEMRAIQQDLEQAYESFLTAEQRTALVEARERLRPSAGGRGRR
jgi:hypothetical protein